MPRPIEREPAVVGDDPRVLGKAAVGARAPRRTPSSSTRQCAGANRRASTDIRTGSSTRSRRRGCGSGTRSGTTPIPSPKTSVCATPCGT